MVTKKKTTVKKASSKFDEKAFERRIESKSSKLGENCKCNSKSKCTGGCSYFLGFIGGAVYYIGTAATFGGAVVGFLKALVWPAFLVYNILKFVM